MKHDGDGGATVAPAELATPAERFDLSGRVALVTGGSRGLGRAMVLGMASAGADVVIASRKLDACRALAEHVSESTGRRALPIACHVGRWAELEGLVEAAYHRFGRVDILVNNAGMSPLYPEPAAVSEELWDKVLGVNLKGPFRLIALVGPRMAEQGGGSIINISSTASTHPRPDVIPYAAAKAGLIALTKSLAREFGPRGIRANAIAAGWREQTLPDELDGRLAVADTPTGRLVSAGDISATVAWLLSPEAEQLNGEILHLDGGYTITRGSRPDPYRR
jgi:NAD(P)-dependent dehydrogenase (short-subunit alcohol dehydrogenase family)